MVFTTVTSLVWTSPLRTWVTRNLALKSQFYEFSTVHLLESHYLPLHENGL